MDAYMHLGIYVLERAFDRPDVSPIVFKVSSSAYFLIQHLTVFSILSSLLAFVTANFYILTTILWIFSFLLFWFLCWTFSCFIFGFPLYKLAESLLYTTKKGLEIYVNSMDPSFHIQWHVKEIVSFLFH